MFKLAAALAFLSVALCAPQYYNPYQPFSPFRTYTPTPILSVTPTPILRVTPSPYVAVTPSPILPYVPVARSYNVPSAESQAPILRQDQDVAEDGRYAYGYQTGNGISAQETGGPKVIGNEVGNTAQGSYSYTSPEGQVVSIQYIADENGFRAVGDAIPTPPPIPAAIARSLAYNAAHPEQEQHYVQRYY